MVDPSKPLVFPWTKWLILDGLGVIRKPQETSASHRCSCLKHLHQHPNLFVYCSHHIESPLFVGCSWIPMILYINSPLNPHGSWIFMLEACWNPPLRIGTCPALQAGTIHRSSPSPRPCGGCNTWTRCRANGVSWSFMGFPLSWGYPKMVH